MKLLVVTIGYYHVIFQHSGTGTAKSRMRGKEQERQKSNFVEREPYVLWQKPILTNFGLVFLLLAKLAEFNKLTYSCYFPSFI